MSERTVACVMEQTLGNVTHYLNMRKHEGEAGCLTRWLPVEYQNGSVPWTVTGSLLARRALRPALREVDAVFMHTATLAPLTVDYFRHKPTILSSDGTPLNKRGMRPAYGLRPERRELELAKRLVYRQIFARATGFVAWSNWTKQSFVDDYDCREEDVIVIPPGIDLDAFSNPTRSNELPRILFVGGDFLRKGGDLLLEVFRRRLRNKAELLLVTRAELPEEPGVRVFRDLQPNSQALRDLYLGADLFVLPSRADCYSLVCMEALAAGLPLVVTRVGGIPDMVHEGVTGHLVDVDDAQALGDALEALVQDPALRLRMGADCRRDAEARFDARKTTRRLFEFVCARA
jgi:glycosyltransferase involved in cell wall biosynthesis